MGRPRSSENQHLPDHFHIKKRKRKSGKIVKYYFYRLANGVLKPLSRNKNEAMLESIKMNIERENKAKAPKITFTIVAKRYQTEIISLKKTNTAKANQTLLKALLVFFHNAPLEEIEPQHIRQYLDARKKTPAIANNEIGLFHHIWSYARQWGYTKLPCPSEGIKKYPIKKRDVYVEDHIYQLVYQHATPDMQDLMDLAYLTGQRPVDVVNIRREHIFDGFLHIVQQKTKAKLRIEYQGKLKEILDKHLKQCNDRVFYSKNGTPLTAQKLGKQFARLRRKVAVLYPDYSEQIRAFQFRDLRAKSGTDKAMLFGEDAARQQLGHTTVQMTKTYIRKAPVVSPLDVLPTNKKGE